MVCSIKVWNFILDIMKYYAIRVNFDDVINYTHLFVGGFNRLLVKG